MQKSIPKHKLTRAASLVGTGARIGTNYAKYYAKKAVGNHDRDSLHEDNARDTYSGFSKLKGGPLKVAQMLSIDKGLLPPAYQRQFQQAQYSAPPLSFPLVVRTFKREFGKHPDELFDSFTREATNAASIGQVHKATRGDKTYAVKIQYPGVAQSLKSDLRIVRPLATQLFNLKGPELDNYFAEVEERLLEECNYHYELERSIRLSAECSHLEGVHFPSYYPELSSSKVIVMDWIEGQTIDQWADAGQPQEELDRIGQALWDFNHFQVHELREFHADPHPGNFLIQNNQLFVIDFGCTKVLDDDFYRRYFRLLDREQVTNESVFEEILEGHGLLLPTDSPRDRKLLKELFRESIELLRRPYYADVFNFGDEAYMNEIYNFGTEKRKDKEIDKLSNARGSRHAIYLNRAYFGIYSLLGRIKARIRATLPQFAKPKEPKAA